MTGAGAGLFSALAVMLGVAVLARALARRFGLLRPATRGRLRMEVVQRLALSPKQGLAVVRIGDRLMTVSMGDGGVRPLLELGDAELAALAASASAATDAASGTEAAPAPARLSLDALVPVLAGGISRGVTLLRRGARGGAEDAEGATPSPSFPAGPAQPAASASATVMMEQEMGIMGGRTADVADADPPRADPVAEAAEAAAPAVEAKPAARRTRTRRARSEESAAPAQPAAKTARRGRSAGAKKQAAGADAQAFDGHLRTALRAAAVLLIATAGGLLPARAAAQDFGIPGMEEIAEAARQEIGVVTQTAAALQQGAPAAEEAPAQAPASAAPRPTPRRPIRGTVAAKADSAFAGAPRLDVSVGQGEDGLKLSGTVGVVVMMGLLSLIPALVLLMTGFTRILIVLHFLRQALGTQTAPPAHLIGAMALLLTGFVMAPTLGEVNRTALQPWLNGEMTEAQMLQVGQQPFREFMLRQARESDVALFVELSRAPAPASVDQVPLTVLASAFVTSELRTAFQMGFVLFLPFIVIDLVVASVLMSMGMMMLPPAMIALPFKLLLFVLVDGWALVVQGLVNSFR